MSTITRNLPRRRSAQAAMIAIVAAATTMAACAREKRNYRYPERPPPPGYAQPGYGPPPGAPPRAPPPYYGGPPAQPGQPPPAPHAPPPAGATAIGTALTTFGMILQSLPPMPPPEQWGNFPWPLEWVPPGLLPPGMIPQPTPQPPAQPQPTPAPPGAPMPTPAPKPPAAPGTDDWPADWIAFEDAVLSETNARRAQGGVCGSQAFGPAGPVRPDRLLRRAARGHSSDMANRGFFDHTNPDGRSPADRASAAGYRGGFVGENIAGGQTTPRQVVDEWMDSPGHCLNIMDPRYTVLGVGYAFRPRARFRHYWTQNFGG